MTARIRGAALGGALALAPALGAQAPAIAATGSSPMAAPYTFADVRSYPFPNELVAAPGGARIAWAFNEQGRRNVWVAEGPAFTARQLTRHARDDGQELTSLSLSPDGSRVVLRAESVCCHGDTPGAVGIAAAVRAALAGGGVRVEPPPAR